MHDACSGNLDFNIISIIQEEIWAPPWIIMGFSYTELLKHFLDITWFMQNKKSDLDGEKAVALEFLRPATSCSMDGPGEKFPSRQRLLPPLDCAPLRNHHRSRASTTGRFKQSNEFGRKFKSSARWLNIQFSLRGFYDCYDPFSLSK